MYNKTFNYEIWTVFIIILHIIMICQSDIVTGFGICIHLLSRFLEPEIGCWGRLMFDGVKDIIAKW